LTQFMQVTMSNHKSTESALKNLEVQVGQLAEQITDKSSNSFVANTKQNPKEECKTVMTRSKRFVEVKDEDSVVHEKKTTNKKGTDGKKNEVKSESNQEKEEQIMVKNNELKDQEKEKEIENEKKMKKKKKIIRMQRRVGVKKLWMKVWKYRTLWYLPRKKKIVIWQDF